MQVKAARLYIRSRTDVVTFFIFVVIVTCNFWTSFATSFAGIGAPRRLRWNYCNIQYTYVRKWRCSTLMLGLAAPWGPNSSKNVPPAPAAHASDRDRHTLLNNMLLLKLIFKIFQLLWGYNSVSFAARKMANLPMNSASNSLNSKNLIFTCLHPKQGFPATHHICSKYYTVLKWESRFTFGLNAAEITDFIKKLFK